MKQVTARPLLLFITFIFVLTTLTVSCSLTKGKEYGERAVEKFHQQFNAGQYQQIYQQGDDKFKEVVTEAEFIEILEAVRRKLGTAGNAIQTGWRVNATPMGTVATLSYEVEFNEGKGNEQFSFLVNGEEAKLLRYDINSPVFITK